MHYQFLRLGKVHRKKLSIWKGELCQNRPTYVFSVYMCMHTGMCYIKVLSPISELENRKILYKIITF